MIVVAASRSSVDGNVALVATASRKATRDGDLSTVSAASAARSAVSTRRGMLSVKWLLDALRIQASPSPVDQRCSKSEA